MLIYLYSAPAGAVACTDNGSMHYDTDRLGYISCASNVEKRLGSFASSDSCSNTAEMQWDSSQTQLEFCNNSEWVALKCGAALGTCTEDGAQRYESGSMQMCDGSNWYSMSSESCIDNFSSVNWVAVSSGGVLLTSENGINWIWADLPTSDYPTLSNVKYGDGRWMVGGVGPTLLTSTDGKVWTEIDISSLSTRSVSSIAYGDGNWMLSFSGPGTKAFSSDGLTWNATVSQPNTYASDLHYANGIWYAAGFHVYSSDDNGTSWSNLLTMPTSGRIVYANGKLVLSSRTDDVDNWRYSEDYGTTWQSWDPIVPNINTSIYDFQYNRNNFYFGDQSSNIRYISSLDTTATIVDIDQLANSLEFGNGLWAFSRFAFGLKTSDDDLSSYTLNYQTNRTMSDIEYGGLVNDPGTLTFTNQTDVSLTTAIISDSITMDASMTSTQKVYAGNGAQVRINGGSWVDGDGTSTVTAGDTLEVSMTTPFASLKEKVATIQVGTDITHWSVTTEEFIVSFALTSHGNASGDPVLALSEDGKNWIQIDLDTLGFDIRPRFVKYGGGKWFIGTDNSKGIFLESTDGLNWVSRSIPDTFTTGLDEFTNLAYKGDGEWMAVVESTINGPHYFYRSTDNGATWTATGYSVSSWGWVNNLKSVGDTWIHTHRDIVRTSIDDGVNWSVVSSTDVSVTSVSAYNNGVWYSEAGIYSDDNFGTWNSSAGAVAGKDVVYNPQLMLNIGDTLNNADTKFSVDSGQSFTTITHSGHSADTHGAGYGDGLFITNTWGGFIATSTDLQAWDNTDTITYATNNDISGVDIEYGGIHNYPGNFNFTDQTDVSLTTAIISDSMTMDASMTSTQKVYAGNGAQVRINGGSWVDGDGTSTVTAGDTLEISMTTPLASLKEKVATIQVGSHVTHWSVTTEEFNVSWIIPTETGRLLLSKQDDFTNRIDTSLSSIFGSSSLGITYGNGAWVSYGGRTIAYSNDGMTWNEVDLTSVLSGSITSMLYWSEQGKWIINARDQFAYSTDLENWSIASGSRTNFRGAIANLGDKLIAADHVGSGNRPMAYTTDGETWSDVASSLEASGLIHLNGVTIASEDVRNMYMSTDAFASIDSSYTISVVVVNSANLASGAGDYVFIPNDNNGALLSITKMNDAINNIWTYSPSKFGGESNGGSFGNGYWIVEGYSGRVGVSSHENILSSGNFSTVLDYDVKFNSPKYGGIHNDPGNFSFTDQTDVNLITAIISDSITIDASMTNTQKVYAGNGAQVRINGGSWVDGDGTSTVTAGDTLEISMTSVLGSLKEKVSTIQVGTRKTHWSVTTKEFNATWIIPAQEGTERYLAVSEERPSSASDFVKVDTTAFYGTNRVETVAYGNGMWVAARGDTPIYSYDGLNWTEGAAVASASAERIVYWDEKELFVWDDRTNNAYYSSDGINWSTASGGSNYSDGFAYSKNYAFLGFYNTGNIKRSSDGQTWADSPSGKPSSTNTIAYGDGILVATSALGNGSYAYSENEAVSFTDVSNSLVQPGEITYGGGYFIRPRHNFQARPIGYATVDQLKTNVWDSITPAFNGTTSRMTFGNGDWMQHGFSGRLGKYNHTNLINDIGGALIYDVGGLGWSAFGGLANDPGHFVFTDITNTTPNAVVQSDIITIDASLTNTQYVYAGNGAEVQVNGGSWLTGTGSATVVAGDTFRVRMNASNHGALRQKVSTVQVGTQKVNWQVTNIDFDNTPTAVDFTDESAVTTSTLLTSDIIQISGIGYAVDVSISLGSEYRTCDDASCVTEVQSWSNFNGYIDENDYIQVRHTSSASGSTTLTSTLNIGDAVVTWDTTTSP